MNEDMDYFRVGFVLGLLTALVILVMAVAFTMLTM